MRLLYIMTAIGKCYYVVAVPPSSTPAPPSTSCVEPPSGSEWGEWGTWSECTKPCDYGLQNRRRVCGQIPCDGLPTEVRPCNEFDCPSRIHYYQYQLLKLN